MQRKILFVLLFMLSFSVMHDTIIYVLEDSEEMSVVEYIQTDTHSKKVVDINDIHHLFHFIALVGDAYLSFCNLKKENRFSLYALEYTNAHLNTDTKPPIVSFLSFC